MAGSVFDLCSSSPPTSAVTLASPPSNQQRVRMSTLSPAARSPPGSSKNRIPGALKTRSRAAPVPEQAIRGFSTAGSLVKSHHFSALLDDEFIEADETQSRRNSLQNAEIGDTEPKKPKKRATKAVAGADVTVPKPKKPRAQNSKASKDEAMYDAASREQTPTTSFHFANLLESGPSNEPVAPVALTKSGKPRKSRAKKEKVENGTIQTKIPKARITKPRGAAKCTEKRPLKATGVNSLHSANDIEVADITHTSRTGNGAGTHNTRDGDSSIWDKPASPRPNKIARPKQKQPEQALQLEEAIQRRRDWTPPRGESAQELFTDSAGKENNSTTLHVDNGSFTNLLFNFTYAQLDTQPPTMSKPPTLESNGATKKRRVELVDVPGNQGASRNTSPEKGKAPKKKPRTITDFVIDQYAPPNETATKSPVTGDLLGPRITSTTTKVPLNTTALSGNKSNDKPVRQRASSKPVSEHGDAKSKTKAKSKRASAKTAAKPKMVADKLLSPASALLKVSKQDVLFGTSSQLALEESPTLIRHIQQAIKDSEQDTHILSGISAMSPPLWPRLGKTEGKRGLWAASARGDDGQLLEKLDKVYIPEPDRRQELPLLMDGSYDHDRDTSFAGTDDLALGPISVSSDLSVTQEPLLKDASERFKDEASNDAIFDNIDNYTQALPPSNQKAESSFLDIDDFPAQPYVQSRDLAPDALQSLQSDSSFLDIDDLLIQPSNPPATTTSTGSPGKRRGRPPKSQSVIPGQPKSTTPKKPVSRSKTNIVAPPSTLPKLKGRFANIEEILDSEDDEALSPTPPRMPRRPDSALPLVPSMPPLGPTKTTKAAKSAKVVKPTSEDVDAVKVFQVPHCMLEWATAKSSIFPKITDAIRKLPPTTDVRNPSWHEKIVLYDAIVLEDLTAFLNINTEVRAFKRATQKQVKAWNKKLKQERREKLGDVGNGKEDDGGLTNVVEKELEVWMVQGWCQEMSVCCINKIRGGRSGMGKGLY